ncbi:MAG: hypothetical protein KKB13_08065 [Chloroflexi bacterium]|nr:hypothetical protein [Chloroflexota bacterium]MBU1877951.1 hypothetical protein [Chloroflexota bacterium]
MDPDQVTYCFGTQIPALAPAEKDWITQDLAPLDLWDMPEETATAWCERTGIEEPDGGHWPGFWWDFGPHDDALWIYSADYFDPDHVVSFVRRFLARFRPDHVFHLAWDYAGWPHQYGQGRLVVSTTRVIFTDAIGDQRIPESLARPVGVLPPVVVVSTPEQIVYGTAGESVQQILTRLDSVARSA